MYIQYYRYKWNKYKQFNLGKQGVQIVTSKEGSHQGDVFATLIYCLSDLDHSLRLKEIVGSEGIAKLFVDDKNFHAEHDTMRKVLAQLIKEGPKVGYFLNRKKSVYLLGKWGNADLARRR